MTPPLVIEDNQGVSGVSQRRNAAVHGPQEEAMPPSIRIIIEAERLSRGRNMGPRGRGATILTHVIWNVQEKTRKAQRRHIAIQHLQAMTLPLSDASIKEAEKESLGHEAYFNMQALRHYHTERIRNPENCLAS